MLGRALWAKHLDIVISATLWTSTKKSNSGKSDTRPPLIFETKRVKDKGQVTIIRTCSSHLAKRVQVWRAMAEAGMMSRACLGMFAERVVPWDGSRDAL